jgi:hypothetical protein
VSTEDETATQELAVESSRSLGVVRARPAPDEKETEKMGDLYDTFNKASNDLAKAAQDFLYVAVGLGVIGFQKAQVRRQEIQKLIESQIASQRGTVETPVSELRTEMNKALKDIDKNVTQLIERFDAAFVPVEERLPAGAQALVHQARGARDQLRGYLSSGAA